MKKKAMMCMVAALCLSCGMTAYAAPETMPDGTIFDAEFYAQIYPDVVEVFGTDADAMYQHYVKYGRNEGRYAYIGDVPLPAVTETTVQQTEEGPGIIGIQGGHGQWYELPTWGDAEEYIGSTLTDKMITMEVRTTQPGEDQIEYDMELLAPYTTAGYEWKPLFYIVSGEYTDAGRWWANYYWDCEVENQKDWRGPEEDAEYKSKFTVTWNGVDYTECKLARAMSTGQWGEVAVDDGLYLLLPKGYDGKIYLTVKGAMLDEYGTTANDNAAVTFVY